MVNTMSVLEKLRVRIFADTSKPSEIERFARNPLIKGFTTNPTLMRASDVKDYERFARWVIEIAGERPVSFEVTSDDFDEMIREAQVIASWGSNVNVKIPVTNTRGEFAGRVIETLSSEGIVVNVTAVMTITQVQHIAKVLSRDVPAIVSIFAGRIADTGKDPVWHMMMARTVFKSRPWVSLLWASPRELLNIFQAVRAGCDIITCTSAILAKFDLVGKNLTEYSLETVRMFHRDAREAGFEIL
jgi:transaldolase